MIVEICCTSMPSVEAAIMGGASRLEVCENLLKDGLTPSMSFLGKVIQNTSLPIHVLIRPREGNFVYTESEITTTMNQIELAKEMGVHGVVVGALNSDHSLPIELLKKWIEKAKPLDLTFHRAFDQVIEPVESLKKIIDLGFNRILTSGQATIAAEGLDLLVKLKNIANEQLTIMPGGGINPLNCELFFKEGFKEVHLSAKGSNRTPKGEPISDPEIIKKVVASASKFA